MKYSNPQASSSSFTPQTQLSGIKSQFQSGVSSKAVANNASRIAQRIELWAGGQPELTRILCDYVVQYAPQVTEENPEQIVDLIIEREIADGWENSLAATHLDEIEQAIVQNGRKDSALILYIQILQRGSVAVNSDNPEQAVLLRSGLVKSEDSYLKVANPLYKKAFDLEKVEQMLPGITKPVKIIPPADGSDRRPSKASALYSKVAVIACGLAIVVTSISSYIRQSGGRAMATGDESALVADSMASVSGSVADVATAAEAESTTAAEDKVLPKGDRALFDSGEDHAINSRWVLMMRDFCAISETSMYHAPAKKQTAQLFKLYSEDIQLARDVVEAEKGAPCPM